MRSSIISLPFLSLYLVHAWLFTFDVLLLSRRRARTPVAVGTLCILLGTLLYVIVTCGNLSRLEVKMPDLYLSDLGLSGRKSAGDQPASLWSSQTENFGAGSWGPGGDQGHLAGQVNQNGRQATEDIPKQIKLSEVAPSNLDSQAESSPSQTTDRSAERWQPEAEQSIPKSQNSAEESRDADMIFSGLSARAMSPCVQCPDNRDWFLEQLAHLSRRVDHLHAQVAKCACSALKFAQAESDLDAAIHRALKLYDADKTGMADYALESAGGSVLSTRCTETHDTSMGRYYMFGFIPLFWQRPSPRWAIQPTLAVGQCWPFKGSVGYLVLRLSRRVKVEAFALEHIPASLAPTGNIDSAPNHFQVFGLENEDDTDGTLLGNYSYSTAGEPLQHFKAQETAGDQTFDTVELKILSNHGNIHYTCLYRFRVHGKPAH
ncbi:SUN domain-containing protein 1-like [Tropilaelaps mercedesae]|uniref:SUN domain-containing protein 1-like n=1 Tax=Tropilaelaps mercedesae TaxID=418985 RepID=A0A1V9XHU3_9ACAR|nr:SUN domain-containing protein 1-like [Tropilaelaps mercedesae]